MRCVSCKGRGLCGRPICPIIKRFEKISALPRIGNSLEGYSPPEVFVGRHNYPLVRAGPMIPAVEVEKPSLDMDIGEIITLRSSMIRSEARVGVNEATAPGKILEACQQVAMSSVPVGTEISFLKPPKSWLQFDGVLAPSGPTGELKGIDITTNPFVPRKVDQIVEDNHTGAAASVGELYSSGIGTDHISRLLSLGLLGRKRKLVPTRWSITASDDIIGKQLRDSILDMSTVSDYFLYSGEGLGNHFEILLLPRDYSFELIEIWMQRSVWSQEGWIGSDSEDQCGKKGYSPLSGGYYAARLAVLEHLARQGKQSAIIAIREISEKYWAPLGVWVVRDVARAAMNSAPQRFSTLNEALGEMSKRLKTPSNEWRSYSKLISGTVQSRLSNFF
ncbi:MAG: Nre family DNA repair protein [Methanotrichaceae archaeon]